MIVISERVSLRYARTSDAKCLYRYTGNSQSSKYLARRPHESSDETLAMLTRLSTPDSRHIHGKCVWVISLEAIDLPVGMITLISSLSGYDAWLPGSKETENIVSKSVIWWLDKEYSLHSVSHFSLVKRALT